MFLVNLRQLPIPTFECVLKNFSPKFSPKKTPLNLLNPIKPFDIKVTSSFCIKMEFRNFKILCEDVKWKIVILDVVFLIFQNKFFSKHSTVFRMASGMKSFPENNILS